MVGLNLKRRVSDSLIVRVAATIRKTTKFTVYERLQQDAVFPPQCLDCGP